VADAWKQRVAGRAAMGIVILVTALCALLVWSYHRRASESVQLAVLPFQADSGSAELAATISQSVSHRLVWIRGFTVLPVSLTARYATSHDSAHAIARALGVRYLVIGRVHRSPTLAAPDRITIDARLIDTEDSPPAIGYIVSTLSTELCPAIATIAVDIAGHFARAPRGPLWGRNGTTGCASPRLLEERDDPSA
jgi:TolB-like protein